MHTLHCKPVGSWQPLLCAVEGHTVGLFKRTDLLGSRAGKDIFDCFQFLRRPSSRQFKTVFKAVRPSVAMY